MIATYAGRCPVCGRRIIAGRSLIEHGPAGWSHPVCAVAAERTLEALPELQRAAAYAIREGWHEHETEVIRSAAKRLDVPLWRDLAQRLMREASEVTARA